MDNNFIILKIIKNTFKVSISIYFYCSWG